MFWAGWNDLKDEGTFANALSGKELKEEDGFWPWYPGEPNGGILENCAVVWPIRNGWNDYMCFQEAYGYCKILPRPILIMRGESELTKEDQLYTQTKCLCKGLPTELEEVFDSRYTMATDKFINGHYSFDGYTNTRIIFDPKVKLWKMELLSDTSINATTEVIPMEYPLGSNIWNVAYPAFSGQLELNLNSCDDLDSFGCNDGNCVSMEERFGAQITD